MDVPTSPIEWAGLTALFGTVGTGAWKLLTWIFGRNDRREAKLDAREDELEAKIEARFAAIETELKDTRRDLNDCKERDAANQSRIGELVFILRIVADEMHDREPANPMLKSIRQILARAFPAYPADMQASLDTLDRAPLYPNKGDHV
jgi:hypothetical protein